MLLRKSWQRSHERHDGKSYQCKHTGGIPPLGYDIDPNTKKYVINEVEAKVVREIFSLYLDGYGYRRMITVLNQKGCKTKRGNTLNRHRNYFISIVTI
ncbi:recombinase family protein [Desulfosporosinus sp. BICA1-9]|uniref:recombinase family protein n=1 Tax=Desulfosporosinus sp. BICA1-9 TaxID=1531958 RepID=UPI0034559FB3